MHLEQEWKSMRMMEIQAEKDTADVRETAKEAEWARELVRTRERESMSWRWKGKRHVSSSLT